MSGDTFARIYRWCGSSRRQADHLRQVARAAGLVGAPDHRIRLAACRDSAVPCHRVVDRFGRHPDRL
jgi:alkylated DNA nucleotide flippase Atl1